MRWHRALAVDLAWRQPRAADEQSGAMRTQGRMQQERRVFWVSCRLAEAKLLCGLLNIFVVFRFPKAFLKDMQNAAPSVSFYQSADNQL